MDLTKDAIETLMAAGKVNLVTGHGDPFAVVPSNMKVEDVGRFYPPRRVRARVKLQTPQAFCEYVNRFKDEDSVIFANVTDTAGTFEAILDYHIRSVPEKDGGLDEAIPRHAEHRAVFAAQVTTEWKRWMEANTKQRSQAEFAEWLEENQDLLVVPSGADLLELVQNLEGKNHVRFNSAMRLNSGRNALAYDEDVELKGSVTSQSGKIEVPTLIEAGIAPFHGVAKYRVRARLKYRIASRQVTFWFETISPHVVVRDALNGVCATILDTTKLPMFLGEPG